MDGTRQRRRGICECNCVSWSVYERRGKSCIYNKGSKNVLKTPFSNKDTNNTKYADTYLLVD